MVLGLLFTSSCNYSYIYGLLIVFNLNEYITLFSLNEHILLISIVNRIIKLANTTSYSVICYKILMHIIKK